MDDAPMLIAGAKVLMYTPIDHRHRPTNSCNHTVAGVIQTSFAGLAICRYENEVGFYLLYCDRKWNAITDTWHSTLVDAMGQAEFEHENICSTWKHYTQ